MLFRSQLEPHRAILVLQRYVHDVPTDAAAWGELLELYCELRNWQAAQFAVCQRVLLLPGCPVTACRAGDLYFQTGALLTSRAYYAYSIQLEHSARNLRAVMGLWLTASVLATKSDRQCQSVLSKQSHNAEITETREDPRKATQENFELLRWSETCLRAAFSSLVAKDGSNASARAWISLIDASRPAMSDAASSVSSC